MSQKSVPRKEKRVFLYCPKKRTYQHEKFILANVFIRNVFVAPNLNITLTHTFSAFIVNINDKPDKLYKFKMARVMWRHLVTILCTTLIFSCVHN